VKHSTRLSNVELSPSQIDQLQRYAQLLAAHSESAGLMAPSDVERVWERHILDSLRAGCGLPTEGRCADVGSGAGLPGIPLAMTRPDLRFVLLEPKRRRVAFLELVIDELRLSNVSVHQARVEESEAIGPFDVITARAFAPPAASWERCRPLLTDEGWLLYFAGAAWKIDTERGSLANLGPRAEICAGGEFPWQGPVVMMKRALPA
jgi:16S rRNA (guanine527-N7)-methyltransferase